MASCTSGLKPTDTNRCVCKERIAGKKATIFKLGRNELVCVQRAHRLQNRPFSSRPAKIDVLAQSSDSLLSTPTSTHKPEDTPSPTYAPENEPDILKPIITRSGLHFVVIIVM
ncbi:hypothetical protein AVEN_208185-1 [Araneus ventricosus]|uniref:Uncharacterized protein n=1 Tax=Araneus ventricosus TaxID=182803 RepID=A0A4Y2J0B9_ARAVE|nr:hypothetical protein AVEN_208185-1 [Araneus ventricosus]